MGEDCETVQPEKSEITRIAYALSLIHIYYYSYKTWGAAATYHLCVDSSVLGIDETVGYIEEFVRKKLTSARMSTRGAVLTM